MGRLKKKTRVKERTVYVYPPTEDIVNDWKEMAERAGMSLSSLVQEAMDYYQQQFSDGPGYNTLQDRYIDSQNRVSSLQQENATLLKKIDRLETLLDRYEQRIKDKEKEQFLTERQYKGIRQYNQRLIALFKKYKKLSDEQILDKLNIPPGDIEYIRTVQKQIDYLMEYGLIKQSGGKYVWQG